MTFDGEFEPDFGSDDPPDGPASVDDSWDAAGASEPDSLDRVIEVADMMAVFAAQRLVWIDVVRREAMTDAERHGLALTEVIERSLRLELATALRITEYAAGELITLSDAIVRRYPAVLESLSRAGMTERHASLLVTAVDALEPEFRDDVLPRAIALAEAEPVGTFRRKLRRLIDTVRAATLTERYETALEARRAAVEPAEDAMAWLHLSAPAVEVHAVFDRATAIAKVLMTQDGETRTLDQLRSDVICDLLIDGHVTAHPGEAHGIRATVAVTIPALALLAGDGASAEPAQVEGVGPIPFDRARELCGDAKGWMRILTHPETGMVLSVGRTRYRTPPELRRLVQWRADRCMGPGCTVPASRCEIDHSVAWEYGGETSLENLCPLCKGHHTIKHHGDWTVNQLEGSGGALEWISPTGRRYVIQPERRVPVFRLQSEGSPPF